MKKYNLSNIMKRAWELVKNAGMTISSGLKKAWEEAKAAAAKKSFTGYLKMAVAGRESYSNDDDAKYVSVKAWSKNGMNRIYFNDYKRRTLGYIDRETREISCGRGFALDFLATIEKFAAEYAF